MAETQPLKASSPILVIFSPDTPINDVHPSNARLGISVIKSESSTASIFVLPLKAFASIPVILTISPAPVLKYSGITT